ncbi:MAG: pilus assembly protein PilM [Desulfobacteraceae bacterium]|nr:pilus assembly protein PilM [Desulfobacteraceae bacterium]MBC2755765.1 pilus assembly protein PilM [Desulfobacteraceae bacterium]
MSRKIFSIDIRDNGISALLVENSLKGNRIQAQQFVPYMDINDEPVNAVQRITETLNKITKEINVSGAEYIVSISPELISYRNLQVPFKDRKKIRQVLPFELEPTLPYPVDEVTIDFQTILQAEKTDILVSVVKTAEINEILDVLKEFNITPYIVTPGGLSSVLCLSKFSETENDFLFVDIDEKYATVFAVVSGHVHIARSFYSNVADPHLKAKKLSENIIQVIAAFESLFVTDFEPSKILLSGNGIDREILNHEMEESLGMPITPVDMFKNINLKISISSDSPFDSANMNNALSLAAIEILDISTINFYGERSIIKKYWEEYKNDFIKTGLIAAFVFVLAMFNVLFEAHFLQKEVNRLNRQIAFIFQSTFPDETKIVSPFQQMKVNVGQEREKNMFTGEIEEEILNIDILNEISSRIPKKQDVEITNFVRGDDSLLISGNTDSFNIVDDIKGRLEGAEILKNITISSANLEKSTNRIQFKLKIDL